MSLINMAAQLFISKLGSNGDQLNLGSVVTALQNLLPTQNGELDLSALIAQFTNGNEGLANLASSWLSGGDNAALSPSTLLDVLGNDRIANFANSLELGQDTATSGLAQMLPELIDKNSENGDLLGNAVGGLAKGLLGKLF
ncbi:YidB family protein [Marinobacterium iners]|uniref:DUF937 domain-containing protein n=1 Tax=Marinobacterium iners DSM 11526 TaxID=1122198 RepID=A0A1H4H0L8_9GAMM|nr:YidB family protein [Marinobacterium iners]SEB14532.1 protein of unknown function [Marinobacterium iners DSM 11526]